MGTPDLASPLPGAENTAHQIPPGQTDSPLIAQSTPESASSHTEPSSKRTSIESEVSPPLSTNILHLDMAEGQGSGKDAESKAAENGDSNCGGKETSKQPDVAQRNSSDKTLTGVYTLTRQYPDFNSLQFDSD